jgi:hypothetical protein
VSAQHGFFKGRSTVTNLIESIPYVLNRMANTVRVDAIYTDFSKAFDKVSHRLLLRKLAKLGLGGIFLAWIVRASGSQSRRFSVRSGVPQGSQLEPLLLILFINAVFSCFKIFFSVASNSDFANAQPELDFFPVVHRQRNAAQLGEVQEHEFYNISFHEAFSI